jgi:hypothetical protein
VQSSNGFFVNFLIDRALIFNFHLASRKCSINKEDLARKVAKLTTGFTGGDMFFFLISSPFLFQFFPNATTANSPVV